MQPVRYTGSCAYRENSSFSEKEFTSVHGVTELFIKTGWQQSLAAETVP